MEMTKDMNVNLKVKIEHSLALWLLRRGVTQRRWMWNTVYAFMPSLAALAAGLSEVYRPGNSIIWYYSPDDEVDDLDGLLAEVDSIIQRAPTPFGNDNFVVVIERRSAQCGDETGLTFERAEETLDQHPVVQVRDMHGNRWQDWKRGDAKQVLSEMLKAAIPTPEMPITLIRAAVMGRSLVRLAARFSEG